MFYKVETSSQTLFPACHPRLLRSLARYHADRTNHASGCSRPRGRRVGCIAHDAGGVDALGCDGAALLPVDDAGCGTPAACMSIGAAFDPCAALPCATVKIDAKTVKALRDQTGAGMMDCKKALVEAEGDTTVALEALRARGLAQVDKKSGRAASEGTIETYIHTGTHLLSNRPSRAARLSDRTVRGVSRRRKAGRDDRGQLRDRLRREEHGVPGAGEGPGDASGGLPHGRGG